MDRVGLFVLCPDSYVRGPRLLVPTSVTGWKCPKPSLSDVVTGNVVPWPPSHLALAGECRSEVVHVIDQGTGDTKETDVLKQIRLPTYTLCHA